MKPTEQDIQAELDRHGLGWNITNKSQVITFDQGGWFEITHKDYQFVIVFFRNSCQTIDFCIDQNIMNEIEQTDFLTGNYDLSAISQHYEPEEWQRIISMCERIVRLITGEQTLEEKVREILEPLGLIVAYVHDDEVSVCNKLHQFWLTRTHIRWASEEKTIEEYHDFDGYYRDEFEQVAALLTPSDQPEQTLEEADTSKPSYSDLEQELAKLKAEYKELDDEFETTHQRHCQARKAMERYQAEMLDLKRDRDKLATKYQRECEQTTYLRERMRKAEAENESLLEKFGPIDQAEQQVAEVETRFQKLAERCERIAEVLIELNEAIL